MTEQERLVLMKQVAADRVVSYARAIAVNMRSGEPIGPTLCDLFLQSLTDHEKAREELLAALTKAAVKP